MSEDRDVRVGQVWRGRYAFNDVTILKAENGAVIYLYEVECESRKIATSIANFVFLYQLISDAPAAPEQPAIAATDNEMPSAEDFAAHDAEAIAHTERRDRALARWHRTHAEAPHAGMLAPHARWERW